MKYRIYTHTNSYRKDIVYMFITTTYLLHERLQGFFTAVAAVGTTSVASQEFRDVAADGSCSFCKFLCGIYDLSTIKFY